MSVLHANYERALIVPDIHHDIPWLERILEQEKGNYDGIIFLGDYSDKWNDPKKQLPGIKDVLQFIWSLRDISVFLMGNHDLPYLYNTRRFKDRAYVPKGPTPYHATGYSRNRADSFKKRVDPGFIETVRVFAMCQGYLLSHAGVVPQLMKVYGSDDEQLAHLGTLEEQFLQNYHLFPGHLLSWVGPPRDDSANARAFSGPLWNDWSTFEDALPWPQVVGHTGEPKENGGWKGRSLCLDNHQQSYACLEAGRLTVHTV